MSRIFDAREQHAGRADLLARIEAATKAKEEAEAKARRDDYLARAEKSARTRAKNAEYNRAFRERKKSA